MKALILIVLSLISFTSTKVEANSCTIQANAVDSKHPNPCSYAIVNEKGNILSCHSYMDKLFGVVEGNMDILSRTGKCPAKVFPPGCSIKHNAFDENHPNACSYAVVDEKGKILSCHSYADKLLGVLEGNFKFLSLSEKCKKIPTPINNDTWVYEINDGKRKAKIFEKDRNESGSTANSAVSK